MAAAALGCNKKNIDKEVRIGSTLVDTYPVWWEMWPTPAGGNIPNYRHPDSVRNLNAKRCEFDALWRAATLANELYPDYVSPAPLLPAAVAASDRIGPDAWVADTGCGYDLISMDDVPVRFRKLAEMADHTYSFYSATGDTAASKTIPIQSRALGETVKPLILKSTPAVLSIGMRCNDLGYWFEWQPFQLPRLWKPDGTEIPLTVRGNVPYIPETVAGLAAPAVEEEIIPVVVPQAAREGEDDAEEDVPGGRVDRKAEAESVQHLMTHLPKNPHCSACQRAKMQNKPHKKKDGKKDGVIVFGTPFGTHITADHMITQSDIDRGMDDEEAGIVIRDLGTRWFDTFAVGSKDALDAGVSLRDFVGADTKVKSFYSDGSKELIQAA